MASPRLASISVTRPATDRLRAMAASFNAFQKMPSSETDVRCPHMTSDRLAIRAAEERRRGSVVVTAREIRLLGLFPRLRRTPMSFDMAQRAITFVLHGLPLGFRSAEDDALRLRFGFGSAPRLRFTNAPEVDDFCHVDDRVVEF